MEVQTNTDLYRFVHVLTNLIPSERVEEVHGGNGGYIVYLQEDAEYRDIGSAIGEAFVKAGYAIVGVHEHHTDDDRTDAYSFVEIDHISHEPVADYFFDNSLHYDGKKFTTGYEGGEE